MVKRLLDDPTTRRTDFPTNKTIGLRDYKTMKLTTFVFADAANTSEDGKLNILGIFSRLTAAEFPAMHPEMQVVLRLAWEPDEIADHNLTLVVTHENSTDPLLDWTLGIGKPPDAIDRSIEINRVLKLQNLAFTEPGRYLFEVAIDGDELGNRVLFVDKILSDSPIVS